MVISKPPRFIVHSLSICSSKNQFGFLKTIWFFCINHLVFFVKTILFFSYKPFGFRQKTNLVICNNLFGFPQNQFGFWHFFRFTNICYTIQDKRKPFMYKFMQHAKFILRLLDRYGILSLSHRNHRHRKGEPS